MKDNLPKIAMTKTSKRIQAMIDKSTIVQDFLNTNFIKNLDKNIQKNKKKFFSMLWIAIVILASLWILKFLLSVWSIWFSFSIIERNIRATIFLSIHTLILWFFVMIYFIVWVGILRKKKHTPYYAHILFITALLILVYNIISVFIWKNFIIYNGLSAFLDLVIVYIIMLIIIKNKDYFDK